ncbi:MAG: hypothetical protein V5A42_00365 [Halofilum sp. (in: g-proteobacteria)]
MQRLAGIAGVRMVAREFGYRRRADEVASRAVEVLNVDAINGSGGVDGSGITVGILSDSMSRTADDSPGDPGVVDGDTTFNGGNAGSTAARTSPVIMRGSRPPGRWRAPGRGRDPAR